MQGCQVGTSKKRTLLTYFQAPGGSQKLRVWICIHMYTYVYICVRFELKFSTEQVAQKPDSQLQNRTPGNRRSMVQIQLSNHLYKLKSAQRDTNLRAGTLQPDRTF